MPALPELFNVPLEVGKLNPARCCKINYGFIVSWCQHTDENL
jgi:hypothetical protein